MKKFISLTLCIAMVCGLLAMNVSAALVTGSTSTAPKAEHFETFDSATYVEVNETRNSKIVDDGTETNNVGESWLPGGEFSSSAYGTIGIKYSGSGGVAGFTNAYSYELTLDVKPVVNSSGIAVVTGGASAHCIAADGIYLYPSVFIEGEWTAIKKVFNYGVSTYYKKAAGASDWTLLVEGTDYHKTSAGTMGNGANFYVGTWVAKADYDNKKANYDQDNFMNAKYWIDNVTISRTGNPSANVIFSFPAEFTFTNTTATVPFSDTLVAANKFSPSSTVAPNWNYYVEFDVKREDGDSESGFSIMPVLGDANDGEKYTRSDTWIKNVPEGNTYNYRMHIGSGGEGNKQRTLAVWKRVDGATEWTEVPYSKENNNPTITGLDAGYNNGGRGGVYGITLYYDYGKDTVAYDSSRADNGGAKFTFSNFVVYNEAYIFNATASESLAGGYDVTVNVEKRPNPTSANYLPIVAAFDGDVLIGVGYGETATGDVSRTYNFATADANTTFKVYLWNPLTGASTDAGFVYRNGPYIVAR